MISFANTAGEIFTLAGVFLVGLALVPWMCRVFNITMRHGLTLYLWHSLFCVIYILYSMGNPADSIKYFLLSLTWDQPPGFGTSFVIFFNSFFTQGLGLSYGGSFFVYNILGGIGLIAFSGALREVCTGKSNKVRKLAAILPFLPGFSFWSTAIGKDSIAFFGVGLICWAAASPYRRFPAMLISFVAILAIRPHIAGFLIIALTLAFALDRRGALGTKLLVNSLVIPSSAAVVALSFDYVGLEELDSLTDYVEQRQSYNSEGGSSVNITDASALMRLFMYIFQPLFFDAGGVLGLFVSFENLVLLGLFVGALFGAIQRGSSMTRFQRLFFLIYVALAWLALANTTANLGIAIRQKTMFTPMLLMLILSYLPNERLIPRRTSVATSPSMHGSDMPGPYTGLT